MRTVSFRECKGHQGFITPYWIFISGALGKLVSTKSDPPSHDASTFAGSLCILDITKIQKHHQQAQKQIFTNQNINYPLNPSSLHQFHTQEKCLILYL